MTIQVRTHLVDCPRGHPFKLEIVQNTPNMIQAINCPTCGIKFIALVGEIKAVKPVDV